MRRPSCSATTPRNQGLPRVGAHAAVAAVHRWEVVGEAVLVGGPSECVVADSSALFGIGEVSSADVQVRWSFPRHTLRNVVDGRGLGSSCGGRGVPHTEYATVERC